jgi:hypothetical protein
MEDDNEVEITFAQIKKVRSKWKTTKQI